MGQTFCCSAADILCMVLYTLFLWSDTPVHSQLMFCMPFCVWRYIPYVSMKRYVLHVQLLLRHLVLPSGNYFSAQSKQLKIKHKTSLALNILWPLVMFNTQPSHTLSTPQINPCRLPPPSPPSWSFLPRKFLFICYADWFSYLFVSVPPSNHAPRVSSLLNERLFTPERYYATSLWAEAAAATCDFK